MSMKPLAWRSVFCALGACLLGGMALLAGCRSASSSGGRVPVTFQTDWYPQPEHGGFYTALLKGYYRDEGLEVTILPGGPFTSNEALVSSGEIEFAMNSSDHILDALANSNEPLLAVGATMQHDPQGIMVHEDSPVHTWTDLNGRTVAVKPGSTWWEFLVHKFHLEGVHEIPATFSVANFVADPKYIQQGFLTSEPYFAAKQGAPARMLLNRDAGYDPYRVFYTSQTYARNHPEIVAKFTRASLKGWREYMRDPGPANAMIEKLNPAMIPAWAEYSYATLKAGHFIDGGGAAGDQTGQFDPARWQTMYEQLRALGVLKRTIDPTTAYTTKFLK